MCIYVYINVCYTHPGRMPADATTALASDLISPMFVWLKATRFEGASTDIYISHLFGPGTSVWSVGWVLGFLFGSGSTQKVFGKNPKTNKTRFYFEFPTTADVFWDGGGNFHHRCNISVESPFEAQILDTIVPNSRKISDFGHQLHWNPGTKTGVRIRKAARYICPLSLPFSFYTLSFQGTSRIARGREVRPDVAGAGCVRICRGCCAVGAGCAHASLPLRAASFLEPG